MGSKIRIKELNSIKKRDYKWAAIITLWTFLASVVLTLLSDKIMPNAHISIALVVLAIFVSTGIFFDIIGLAIATASETPFHSMSARKIGGARHAISLIRNAEKASNLCNDVIGDIVGIVSGSTTAAIIARITYVYGVESIFLSLALTGLVAAVTVGGKSIGKGFAMQNANNITYQVALALYYFDRIRGKGDRNGDIR